METIPTKKIIEDSFSKNEIINTVNDDPLPSEINPIELDDLVKKSIIKNTTGNNGYNSLWYSK